MKKKYLLIKHVFHVSNIGLISLYLYPGSILGQILYGNMQIQPQLTQDFMIFSSNHVYSFVILSLLGLVSYHKKKIKILFFYLFFISIFLEICHIFIPQRDFEFHDLYGNFLGVFFVFTLFNLYKSFRGNK
tara:strand:- start:53 stop:445 length:393 start_codon:yes stop_codon:yes gene_type:complete